MEKIEDSEEQTSEQVGFDAARELPA